MIDLKQLLKQLLLVRQDVVKRRTDLALPLLDSIVEELRLATQPAPPSIEREPPMQERRTLGENIWSEAILKWQGQSINDNDLITLREIVIAAIDEAFNDLERDHLEEIRAMEE